MQRTLAVPPVSFLAASFLVATAAAQVVPTGIVVDTLATNLQTPNDCGFTPDGRCLIANSAGAVMLYAGAAAVTIGTVPNVQSGGESGLLSIAADPGFATNGYVYVYYSGALDSFMHLDRFTCTGDLANPASTNVQLVPASRHVLLGALPDNASNHNGGSLRFGPDGKLYLSCGDDASMCNAQSLTSQAGCLLRLDVGAVPPGGDLVLPPFALLAPADNPRAGVPDFSQLVLAHGLRNPYRVEIDPVTGNLYIGDVGAGAIEEYTEYVYTPGQLRLVNFGWPWREGTQTGSGCGGTAPAGLVDPIAQVSHSAGWRAIMGGALYRNLGGNFDFGSGYEGSAFYTDYYAGQIRRLVNTGTWGPAPAVPGQPNPTDWGTGFASLTSLRLGPDGGLWFTQHPGSLKRLRPVGPVPSVAAVSGSRQRVTAGDAFLAPLVVQAFDPSGAPLANGSVQFSVTGAAQLTTPAQVQTDANGFAQVGVQSQLPGGAITVNAITPGALTSARFDLFARRLSTAAAAQFLVVTINNQTDAVPALVPYIIMMSFPGSPSLSTALGQFCIDPFYAGAFFIEDGTGWVGGVSASGQGGVGQPNLTRLYTVPAGLLTGQLMSFQAIGFDPIDGWFRTNCEQRQF